MTRPVRRAFVLALVSVTLTACSTARVGDRPDTGPEGGLSEAEILELVIPGSTGRMAEYLRLCGSLEDQARRNCDDDHHYRVALAGVLGSTFGLAERPLLLAEVGWQEGYCDFCGHTTLGLIDPRSRSVTWRLEIDSVPLGPWPSQGETAGSPSVPGAHGLATTPNLFETARAGLGSILAFRHDHCLELSPTGMTCVEEHWFQPERDNEGKARFRELGAWDVEYSTRGVWLETTAFGCGTMQWPPLVSTPTYTWRVFVVRPWNGEEDDDQAAEDSGLPPIEDWGLPPCEGSESASVAVYVTRRLILLPNGAGLKEIPIETRRIDLHADPRFPLNLSQRSTGWKAPNPTGPLLDRLDGWNVTSPDRQLVCRRVSDRHEKSRVEIVDAASDRVLRTVPLERHVEPQFEPSLVSMGWSTDSQRCMLVLNFELPQVPPALISLDAAGGSDFWEGFVSASPGLPWGFAIDLGSSPPTPGPPPAPRH